MKLRIKFRKYGAVRYIGHLDVMRFFQKAIRRAGIDVKYSSGFSPHQIMTFAAPLGVGITSNGEYMDIEVNSLQTVASFESAAGEEGVESGYSVEEELSVEGRLSMEERLSTEGKLSTKEEFFLEECCRNIRNRLNEATVSGIEIVSVKVLPDTAGNAMASVAAASYTIRFRKGREPLADMAAILPGFLAKDRILVTKKTKKGVREIDLKEGIFRLTWTGEALTMLLDASSSGNIKPVQVAEPLLAQQGESLQENALWVTREDVYTRTEDGRLISLDEIGAPHSGQA